MAQNTCTSGKDHALRANDAILEMLARLAMGADGGGASIKLRVVVTEKPPTARAKTSKPSKHAATDAAQAPPGGSALGSTEPQAPPAIGKLPTHTLDLNLRGKDGIRDLPSCVGLVALAQGGDVSVAAMSAKQKAATFDVVTNLPRHVSTMTAGAGFADAVFGPLKVRSCAHSRRRWRLR
jgi:hypothetical protein